MQTACVHEGLSNHVTARGQVLFNLCKKSVVIIEIVTVAGVGLTLTTLMSPPRDSWGMKHFYGSDWSCHLHLFWPLRNCCHTPDITHTDDFIRADQATVGVLNHLQTTASSFCFMTFIHLRASVSTPTVWPCTSSHARGSRSLMITPAAAALQNIAAACVRTPDNYIHLVGVCTPRVRIIHSARSRSPASSKTERQQTGS